MTNVIRNVFSRIGHVIETNLVDPKEQYQAVLLGETLARNAYNGDNAMQGKVWKQHRVEQDRPVSDVKRAA